VGSGQWMGICRRFGVMWRVDENLQEAECDVYSGRN
jgi:hypothetical protein